MEIPASAKRGGAVERMEVAICGMDLPLKVDATVMGP